MKDVTVVMLELLMNGSTRTILQMRLALHIKHSVMITESDALHKLNARTVFQIKDVGLNRELKFTQLINLMMLKVKRT